MKYRWLIAMVCLSSAAGLLPAAGVVANEGQFAVTATTQIGVTIPARFNPTIAEDELCVKSTGADPYTTAIGHGIHSTSTGHCVAADATYFQNQESITLWVIPE
ncbi:MAG: hypothetical protein V3T15_02145, partial [Pseudomonadales bacterium]